MKTTKLHAPTAMAICISMLIATVTLLCPLFSSSSAAAQTIAAYETPEGFNDNDYQKMLAFLEYVGSSGSSNGYLLLGEDYDPNSPLSWRHVEVNDWGTTSWGVQWEQFDGEYHIIGIDSSFIDLEGPIDFSCFEHLAEVFLFDCVSGDINVSYCPELSILAATYGNAEIVDVRGCPQLNRVFLSDNKIKSIIGLEDCPNIQYLSVERNSELRELDMSAFEYTLLYLFVDYTPISNIDFDNLWAILEVGCSNTAITAIDASACANLTFLDCKNDALEYLLLPQGENNLQVDCSNTGITELDVTGCHGIYQLNCSENPISTLDFSNSPWIQNIKAQNCNLDTLDVAGCENLMVVDCTNNNLSVLDVSASKGLMQLYCAGNKLENIYWHINTDWDPETIVSLNSAGNGYIGIGFEVDEETFFALNYFEATPEAGYKFVSWTDANGNVVSTDARFFYESWTNYELYANFESTGETPEPTDEPIPTDDPVPTDDPIPTDEPIPTDDPVSTDEPIPTDDPTEPTQNPDVPSIPSTGAVSLIGIGIAAVAAGAAAFFTRKED